MLAWAGTQIFNFARQMQKGVGQYKEQDVGHCRVQRQAEFRTMSGVRISDARVLRQHHGQEWGTMPGMGRKQINVTKTSIRDANLHMFLVRLLHTRSPQRLSLVFVLSGFKFGVFLFAVGRDGGRIDLLRRKDGKTGKMKPDKDSKIEQNDKQGSRI